MKKYINRPESVTCFRPLVFSKPPQRTPWQYSHSRISENGAASMVLAAMLLILSGGLVGTYYVINTNKTLALENQGQVDALDEAIANINGYALGHGRFPCIASGPKEEEKCGTEQKGWYPERTLDPPNDRSTDPDYDQSHSIRTAQGFQVRYALSSRLRSAGSGVAEYTPQIVGSTTYPDVQSTLDLCESIRSLALPSAGGRWTTGDGLSENAGDSALLNVRLNGKTTNVAYAVAVLPPGADESAWGAFADPKDAELNGPSSLVVNNQQPLVRYMDAPTLYSTFACDSALMSVDGMTDAAKWSTFAETARIQLVQDAKHFALVTALAIASVAEDTLVVTDIGIQAAYYIASATAKLPGYIATLNALGIANSKLVLLQSDIVISDNVAAGIALTGLAGGVTANDIVLTTYKDKAEQAKVWNNSQSVIEQADRKGVNP